MKPLLRFTITLLLLLSALSSIAQYVQLGNKLTASGGEGNNGIGWSAAISADSSTVVTGTRFSGAFVYVNQGGQWVQQAHLTSSNCISNCSLGWSVAISADGNTIIAGAPGDNDSVGAAFVFKRTGTTWNEEAKLVSPNAAGKALQGISVGVSYNGNTTIIGACNDGDTLGAAFVFVRSGSNWNEQAKLVGTGAVRQSFQGYGVAISADGNVAASVSAVDSGAGATWIYKRTGNVWTQDGAKIKYPGVGANGNGSNGNNFMPRTVSLSGNGLKFSVGDPGDEIVFLYEKQAGVWQVKQLVTTTHELSASPPSFGCFSALNYDGSMLVVSAYRDYSGGATYGYVYIFEDSAGTMHEKFYDYNLNTEFGPSGLRSVAISAGGTVVFGGNTDGGTNGAVWAYTKQNAQWAQYGNKMQAPVPTRNTGLGYSVATTANGNKIISGSINDNGQRGAFWTFSNNVNGYQQKGNKITVGTGSDSRYAENLCLSSDGNSAVAINYAGWVWYNTKVGLWIYKDSADAWVQNNQVLKADSGRSYFWGGGGATISADGNTIVFSNTDAYSDSGAAYVFVKNGGAWVQQAELRGDRGKYQSHRIALSASGDVVILGCHTDTFTYIFRRTAGVWQQDARISSVYSTFNTNNVAVAADGRTVAIGCPRDSSNNGSVILYRYNGNAWLADGKVFAAGATTKSRFGRGVALSADGNTLIASSSGDNGPQMSTGVGAFWQYRRSGNQWLQVGNKYVPNDASGLAAFGTSIAITPNSSKVIIGGTNDNDAMGAVWVFERSGLQVNIDTIMNATCSNSANAQIVLNAQNGASPYHYKWSVPGAPDSSALSGLSEGTYYVTVSDASGDSVSTAIAVGVSNNAIQITTAYKAQCGIANDAWVSVTVQGGALPYQYLWSTAEADSLIENLAAGTYLYTVTDGNGCQISSSTTIPYTTFWTSTYAYAANCAANNGTAVVNAQGGTAPFTYEWSTTPPQTTANLSAVATGTYTVTVGDATGCSVTAKAIVDSACTGSITGTLFVDANNNCILDGNETPIANKIVSATGNGTGSHGITNADGVYTIIVANGTYNINPHLGISAGCGSVTLCGNATNSVTVAGNDTVLNANLAVTYVNQYDLETTIYQNGIPRPGSTVPYVINLTNNGYLAFTGTAVVTFIYAAPFEYASSDIPPLSVDVNTRTITWSMASIATGLGTNITLVLNIPNTAIIGTGYEHTVTVSPISGDCNTDNNTATFSGSIRGANDPNIKSCYPDSIVNESDTVLTYTIQFQNNGNDTTRFITIKDTLSQYVDPASVRTVGASHEGYTFNVSGNGVLTWYFDPIALPDSATDPVNSIGFVSYKINTRSVLPHGTVINNRASIYFDYNEPVATNTHQNRVLLPTGITGIKEGPQVRVFPNPFSESTRFVVNGIAGVYDFKLKDATGRMVLGMKGISNNTFVVDRGNLVAGVYIYSITNTQQQNSVGRIVIQ